MSPQTNLAKELKGLGHDLAKAVKKMKSSQEFKALEKEIGRATHSIAKSLKKSFHAAGKSPETKKIKKRLGRVLTEGKKQGKIEAQRAQVAAAKGIRKGRASIQKLTRR